MTGFGRCQQNTQSHTIEFEIRSVNGRYLDMKWRLPPLVRHCENALEKIVRQFASRGRVEISLSLQNSNNQESSGFDNVKAKAMLLAISDFAKEQNDVFSVDYNNLLRVTGLWGGSEEELSEELVSTIQETLKSALKDWNNTREEEARNLCNDLQNRFTKMKSWLEKIEQRAPQVKESRFLGIRERLQEILVNLESNLEESRFLQEMVIISDKLDVSEEITRLYSHFNRLDTILKSGEDAGRKLDFTLQECFREINTCGNKIQDAELSVLVVDFKNELEKCREQVQNLE